MILLISYLKYMGIIFSTRLAKIKFSDYNNNLIIHRNLFVWKIMNNNPMSNYPDSIVRERIDYYDSRSGNYMGIMSLFDRRTKLEQNASPPWLVRCCWGRKRGEKGVRESSIELPRLSRCWEER